MSRRGWSNTGPVSLRYTAALATAAPVTLAAWGKTSMTGITQYMVSLLNSASADTFDQFALRLTGADVISARCGAAGGVSEAISSTGFTENVWFHAAAVFTSATDRAAFINGGSKGTNATSRVPAGINRTAIGLQDNGSASLRAFGQGGTGDLAEVGIWSAALTDAEIAALATGLSPMAIRPASLIGYWPLVGNNSPENNVVSNTSVMTLVGAPPAAAHPRVIYPGWQRYAPKATASTIKYTNLERGIRGVTRGVATGSYH